MKRLSTLAMLAFFASCTHATPMRMADHPELPHDVGQYTCDCRQVDVLLDLRDNLQRAIALTPVASAYSHRLREMLVEVQSQINVIEHDTRPQERR